ncbi:hypothetical protein MLD38_034968 [Melastoma candidum]|uniref:Uncharacterized protein n=1 Tax=Melastoma candidum TaxID=119954 RepID=A0ACB9MDR1_9MYRT|nr:hypothetical protein MLD38_034968 [Melastoma candidum]
MDCHVSSAAPLRKLPGSTSIYDGVFGGTSVREGGVSSRAEDYAEVFAGGGGGQNECRRAAIPVLDLPCFQEGRLRVDVRRSSLDYLKIFGGGAAGGFVASYEEVVRRGEGTEVGVGRVKTKKPTLPLASNNHLDEASVQETPVLSRNEPKIFNVSYSKSNVGSNGKSNGTVHVAQLADIPGYSVIVEENCLFKRGKVNTEEVLKCNVVSDASEGMVKDVDCRSVPSDVYVKIPAEKASGKDFSQRRFSKEGSFSGEMLFDRCGFTVGKDSYKEGPLYNFSSASFDKKREINGRLSSRSISEGIDHSYSPPDLGSQLDANSAAAASVAALKIAIEKAQARIQLAKEIKEGKKVFDFEVRVNKKFDSEDKKGDKKKVKKECQSSKMLHQQDLDTRGHSVSEIPKPNLAEAELVSGEADEKLKKSISEESNAVMLGENCDRNGVDCWKGDVGNRKEEEEEEDLFEDARAEPYHPVRDELREVIGVKIENESDVLESNCGKSPSIDSAVGENAEAALDEELCHEKANSQLLTSIGAKENKEQMIPFELSEELTREKENAPDIFALSDDIASVKKCVFHFLSIPFENIPELKISKPNVNRESQQMIEHNLELCANDADDRKCGDNLSDEGIKEIKEDLGMKLENSEVEEQPEQYYDIFNREMQTEEPCTVEENSLEHPAASLKGKHENGAGEIYDNVIPRERSDQLAMKNYGDCQEAGEIDECSHCQEDKSGETVSDGSHMEDLKVWAEICDITETVEVPAIKTRRRHWMVEAQDVRRLINVLAANAGEPNVLEQLTGTPGGYERCEDQTADEITDDAKKEEDDDKIFLENVSPKSRDSECSPAEVASDSIIEGEITNEPVESIGSAFGDEELNLGNDVTEAYNSRENTPHIEEAYMDFQPTDDEASDRYDNNDSPAQGPSCEMEDDQVNESGVSDCSGPESEESVKEANLETGVELSDDDLCRFDEMVMEVHQLDGVSTEKQETHAVEVGIDDTEDKEKHQATQTAEATTAEGPDGEMHGKKSGRENAEEKAKEKEREKERQAVERAINEARQRAYAEAKQRAERAAVEKVNAEARQRGIAQAREKVGNSYSAKPSNKADDHRSVKAKIKAERAAVERATAEARERALEKALAEKRTAGDRDSKQGKKSHDQQHRSTGSSGNSRHPSTSDPCGRSEGNDGESAERRKARLERHQRTAERAAKTLAEKNKRDLLAQREQAERNRLAETLDPEIKRWSSGKQGNLRALLSTLQYILGPDSGWQPVTLTEIVTNAAVRKAYKKATLYVHPDKLQQRGASLQQKYICEKVFDLLKDAWNKFSSEER